MKISLVIPMYNESKIIEATARELSEYMVIVNFIRNQLEFHCGTPEEIAFQDALGAAAALSDISRRHVVSLTEGLL